MNIPFPAAASLTLLLLFGTSFGASSSYNLETSIYLFRNSDFTNVEIPAITPRSESRGVVVRSPATVAFDQETLSLQGAHFAWSGGHNPPDRFSLVASPRVVLPGGKPVTLASTVSVQYLEKEADGTLKVREINRDSPQAPHFELTFAVNTMTYAKEELYLVCDLDMATISARQKVPGVSMEVGKPVLTPFKTRVESFVRENEWSALLLRAPEQNKYGLLVLLRIEPTNAGTDVTAKSPAQPMTAGELDRFATHYYQHPEPQRVDAAIAAFGASGFAEDRSDVFVGFFSEVFAANRQRSAAWQGIIDRQDDQTKVVFQQVMRWAQPGAILEATDQSVAQNDRCWGAFFASGNPAYLRKLVGECERIDERQSDEVFWAGATAMWSLARNAAEHPLVRPTLEAAEAGATARTRELIRRVLKSDLPALRVHLMASRQQFLASHHGPLPVPHGANLQLASPTTEGNRAFPSASELGH